ncbi:MAG: hypothetical protein ACI8RZ_007920 [Myxococcota bacterium]|jgi:hypothetical protein
MSPIRLRTLTCGSTLAALGGFLLACSGLMGEPVPQTHQDYIGVWQGIGVELTITAAGRLEYENNNQSVSTSISAPIQQWDADGFDAGLWSLTTHFVVNESPHLVEDTWWMTVEGNALERVRQSAACR